MMCNRLTIKVTKFQHSSANRFWTVAKNFLGGGQICPPYKLGLKGTSCPKKVELKWKSAKNATKRAITDLNAPNGSRHFPFQSQKFGQDGHRHFIGFQPHFHLNMTSQTQCCKTMKKWKCSISGVFCLICLKLCRLLELGKGISLHFKFRCHSTQNQNYCPLLKNKRAIV